MKLFEGFNFDDEFDFDKEFSDDLRLIKNKALIRKEVEPMIEAEKDFFERRINLNFTDEFLNQILISLLEYTSIRPSLYEIKQDKSNLGMRIVRLYSTKDKRPILAWMRYDAYRHDFTEILAHIFDNYFKFDDLNIEDIKQAIVGLVREKYPNY